MLIRTKLFEIQFRNLANGIGWLGFSFGSMIGPIVTNQLIQLYSWRGAFLVLGAINAQRIPLCLFFRTPKRLTSQTNHASGTSSQKISGQMILKYLKETFNFSILLQDSLEANVILSYLNISFLKFIYECIVHNSL